MSQKKVEELADNVLRDCSIFKAPIPINDIAKMQGLAVQAFDFGDDVSGVLVVKDGKGTIGYNPQESIVRKRFTIAHELGHFLLHGSINDLLTRISKCILGTKFHLQVNYVKKGKPMHLRRLY